MRRAVAVCVRLRLRLWLRLRVQERRKGWVALVWNRSAERATGQVL